MRERGHCTEASHLSCEKHPHTGIQLPFELEKHRHRERVPQPGKTLSVREYEALARESQIYPGAGGFGIRH